jgi:hypothetical protein
MKKRVMDLEPPQLGTWKGAHQPAPPSWDQVTIMNVQSTKGRINILCEFEGEQASFHYSERDERTKERVAEILTNNIGKTLLSVGMIEIPED